MKAIDDLKECLADAETQSAEYGFSAPINTEIEIEASLAYRLIEEWPEPAEPCAEVFRCKTLREVFIQLENEELDLPVQVEVTSKQTDQIQLSIRQYLNGVVITPKKIILRALDPEGWNIEERNK